MKTFISKDKYLYSVIFDDIRDTPSQSDAEQMKNYLSSFDYQSSDVSVDCFFRFENIKKQAFEPIIDIMRHPFLQILFVPATSEILNVIYEKMME